MIGFFPSLYPDELVYSLFCRYYIRSGYLSVSGAANDIFRHNGNLFVSKEFINILSDDVKKWLTQDMSMEDVIEKHTMFSAYVRFLSSSKRRDILNFLLNEEGDRRKLSGLCGKEVRYLRYCPICSQEDRRKYGETYWHREHQIKNIRICPRHNCFLLNSEIPLNKTVGCDLEAAENHIPQNNPVNICRNETEHAFTKYVLSVFREPVDFESQIAVGKYLSNNPDIFDNTCGVKRNIEQIYMNLCEFYRDLPVISESHLHRLFLGYDQDHYYVCQIAYYFHISVQDLTHLYIGPKRGELAKIYQIISKKYSIPLYTVHMVGDEIVSFVYEKKKGLKQKRGCEIHTPSSDI